MAMPTLTPELEKLLAAGAQQGLTDTQLAALAKDFTEGKIGEPPAPMAGESPVVAPEAATAPWYSMQGINQRLAPVDPTNPRNSMTDALLAPEMNLARGGLRTLFGLAGEAQTGGPIGTMTAPVKGIIDKVAAVSSPEAAAMGEELRRRGLELGGSGGAFNTVDPTNPNNTFAQALGAPEMNVAGALRKMFGADVPVTERYSTAARTVAEDPTIPMMDIGLAAGAVKGVPKAVDYLAKKGYERWIAPPAETLEYKIANRVKYGVNKGIRPSVFGKGSSKKLAAQEARDVEAITAIIENKRNLKLTQPDGTVVEGSLPKGQNAARQSLEALHQTKASIWEKVDAQLAEAGKGGLTIDTSDISSMLEEAAKNPALNISPNAKTALLNKAEELRIGGGKYSLRAVEEMIQNINAENKAYHKSSNPADTQPAAIKEVVAQSLRDKLDKAVTSQTGPGFQELKNTYGSLVSIEKDLANRVIVSGRAAPISLLDHFANLGAGLETVKALMTADPVAAVKGITMEGIKAYTKRKDNPNHIMESMFEDTDKLMSKRPPVRDVKPELREFPKLPPEASPAEVARAAAEQQKWKVEKGQSEALAAQMAEINRKAAEKLAREREPLRGETTVEKNRAAAEQQRWLEEKAASDALIAEQTRRSRGELVGRAREAEPLRGEVAPSREAVIQEARALGFGPDIVKRTTAEIQDMIVDAKTQRRDPATAPLDQRDMVPALANTRPRVPISTQQLPPSAEALANTRPRVPTNVQPPAPPPPARTPPIDRRVNYPRREMMMNAIERDPGRRGEFLNMTDEQLQAYLASPVEIRPEAAYIERMKSKNSQPIKGEKKEPSESKSKGASDLASASRVELEKVAKDLGIKSTTFMTKEQLLTAIKKIKP